MRSLCDLPRVKTWSAAVAAFLGALTIFGWTSGIEALASVRARYIPMAPTTALCFACLGLALMLHPRAARLARVAAGLVAIVAAAKLVEFFSGASFGIDEFFVADPAMFGQVKKGRMSPITAFDFLLTCAALWTLVSAQRHLWTGRLAAISGTVAMVVILGYIHGTPLLYGGGIIPVALPTAVAFLCLSVSLIAGAGRESWPIDRWCGHSTRALLLRWFVPLAGGGILVSGLLEAWLLRRTTMNAGLISALCTLLFTLAIPAAVSYVARIVGGQIDRAEGDRDRALAALATLNAELEQRVADRTLELRTKNSQMQEDLGMARELQLALLPKHFPTVPRDAPAAESAVRFCSFYYPTGSVSGDFFSVFPISDQQVGIFICDVMGHGVRAALVTSMMRVLMEQHSASAPVDPGALLTRINHGLTSLLRQTGTTLFTTSLVMIADVARGELAFANAGHPNPLLIRRTGGGTEALQGKSGPALGIFTDAEYCSFQTPFAPGDLVLLFTDGLFEVENGAGDLYSYEDLQAAVQRREALTKEELCDGVLAEIREFADGREFEDDVCLVGMEMIARVPATNGTKAHGGSMAAAG
jgi:serine phosphatase RsbU (regulator of sigma subunit)